MATATKARQFTCQYCGYVYNEADGCPDGDIAPGTAWEDIPDDWCCPVCSSEKDSFEPS